VGRPRRLVMASGRQCGRRL